MPLLQIIVYMKIFDFLCVRFVESFIGGGTFFFKNHKDHMYYVDCLRFKVCVLQVENKLVSMTPLTTRFKLTL